MTTATFNLVNLGVAVTFDKSAIRGRCLSFESYALWQAQAWLKHGKAEPGCTVTRIDDDAMTESDRGGVPVAQAQAPVVETPGISAAPVASGEWPKWLLSETRLRGTDMCVVRFDSATWGVSHNASGGSLASGFSDCHTLDLSDRERWLTQAEAIQWLRANNHAAEADRLVAPDLYEPVDVQPRKGDRMQHVSTGLEYVAAGYGQPGSGDWQWRTPVSGYRETVAIYTNRDGTGYRILKRTDKLAGAVVYEAIDSLFCSVAVVVGDKAYYRDRSHWREGNGGYIKTHYKPRTADTAEILADLRKWVEADNGR